MNIIDEYTAFCFDEACAYILGELKEDKKAMYDDDRKENKGLQLLLS
jgi:hypothetical protein